MTDYLVRWEVEVYADSPEEAVDKAFQMLPFPGNDTTATAFQVLSTEVVAQQNGDPYSVSPDSPRMENPKMVDIEGEEFQHVLLGLDKSLD